jgi:hypothetical protein
LLSDFESLFEVELEPEPFESEPPSDFDSPPSEPLFEPAPLFL